MNPVLSMIILLIKAVTRFRLVIDIYIAFQGHESAFPISLFRSFLTSNADIAPSIVSATLIMKHYINCNLS